VFVGLVIQQANCIVNSSVEICRIFPRYPINDTIFREKLLKTKYLFLFPLRYYSEIFLILRRIQPDTIKMYTDLHVQYQLFSQDYNKTWVFLNRFSKNPQIPNFMKIRLMGDVLFEAKAQTDRLTGRQDITKRMFAFRSFANAPEYGSKGITRP
jgi:hypothetical protein